MTRNTQEPCSNATCGRCELCNAIALDEIRAEQGASAHAQGFDANDASQIANERVRLLQEDSECDTVYELLRELAHSFVYQLDDGDMKLSLLHRMQYVEVPQAVKRLHNRIAKYDGYDWEPQVQKYRATVATLTEASEWCSSMIRSQGYYNACVQCEEYRANAVALANDAMRLQGVRKLFELLSFVYFELDTDKERVRKLACELQRYIIDYDRFSKQEGAVWFANVYTVERCYGGAEEGGWYYDSGLPYASILLYAQDRDEARREAAEVFKSFSEGRGNGYGHQVRLQQHVAQSFPARTPRYE